MRTEWLLGWMAFSVMAMGAVAGCGPASGKENIPPIRLRDRGNNPVNTTDGGTPGTPDSGTPVTPPPTDGGSDPVPDAGTGLHPSVRGTDPAPGAINRARDLAVNVDLTLPTLGAGVDNATLSTEAVKLYRKADSAAVPGTVNTSGGGDAIVFQPSVLLDVNTEYVFEITPALKDTANETFLPFSMTFKTDDYLRLKQDPTMRFDDPLPVFNGPPMSSLAFGPDGRLYATALDGVIRSWAIAADGALGDLREIALPQFAGQSIVGLAFRPGPPPPGVVAEIWVTVNAPVQPEPAPDFSGKIVRLTLREFPLIGLRVTADDYVVGLPRSAKDHMSNSLAFGPDGFLYMTQGSITAMGDADPTWFNRPEHLLSASVLRINPAFAGPLPIDVTTEPADARPAYDPGAPDAPVQLYATGIRNAYDLVWHSNGHLYSAANGSAAGGNTPASPDGAIPALSGVATQDDFLFDVVPGGYYGHPNPKRNQYVLNGGNPTPGADPAEVGSALPTGYPVGTPHDPNWRGYAYNFGRNRSPNGTIEYQNTTTFGGRMAHRLIIVEYSGGDDLLALFVDSAGRIPPDQVLQVASSPAEKKEGPADPQSTPLSDPLDVAEDPAGNLYVAQLVNGGRGGGAIVLLRPHVEVTKP